MTLDLRTSRSTIMLLAAFALIAALFAYSFRLVRVQGASMEPTYHSGQWLLVRRLNWPSAPIGHDEVIVFRLDRDTLVKRVAALPGERPPLDDLRLLRLIRPMPRAANGTLRDIYSPLFAPIPAGSLYVLGDNPPRSDDSRHFGPILQADVIGRVVQWAPPDPPEREMIGYTPPRGTTASLASPGKGQQLLALAKLPHP
jgi:signal peptidase I